MPLDLKSTINLPKTDFPMKANLPQNEPKTAGSLGADAVSTSAFARPAQGRAAVCPARWPALRQWAHPSRHCAQQVPEGFRRQVQDHGRIRRSLCPGMGLPWPAHRDQGRPDAGRQEAADAPARCPPGMPQICPEISRSAARAVQAYRGVRTLGPALFHHDAAVRVGGAEDFLHVLRKRLRLQGPARGVLVHARRDRAGRSRSRIRKPHQPDGLGKVRAAGRSGEDRSGADGQESFTIIWTTTPWTLPASMAVAFHPDEEYVALESGGEVYIVAAGWPAM